MNARMILASAAGAMLLVSPMVVSAKTAKDSKPAATAPAKPAKAKKMHKTAKTVAAKKTETSAK